MNYHRLRRTSTFEILHTAPKKILPSFPNEVVIEMRNHNDNVSFGPLFSAVTAMMSPAHQVITRNPLYERVEPLKIHPGPKALTQMIFRQIQCWHQRTRARNALARLDDHMLQDIGIERADALAERSKPFWQR